MKKLLIAMLALCAMVVASSCSSENEVVAELDPQTEVFDSPKASDFETLKEQFSAFNSTYFNAYPTNGSVETNENNAQQAKGWLSRLFKKFLAILTCDWVGAKVGMAISGGNAAGGIVGAIVGSGIGVVGGAELQDNALLPKRAGATDSLLISDYVNTKDVVFNNLTLVDKDSSATLVDSVGYYHNKILYDYCVNVNKQYLLLSKDKNDFVVSVMEDLEDSINCNFGTEAQKKELATTILTEAQKVSYLLQISTSFDDFTEKLGNLYPEYAAELSVFTEYVKGIDMLKIKEDYGEYAKQLLKIVNTSNLTNEQKKQMRMSIDIGHASSHLWNKSTFENME